MPRPNPGPRLKWIKERQCFYILWYEHGRRGLRSTGTADRKQAEAALANFLGERHAYSGPRDPSEVGVAEALNYYGAHHAHKASDPARIGYAIDALLPFWELNSLTDITPRSCDRYAKWRDKAPGTVRRELATITAAQNFMLREGALTRAIPVPLPDKPEPKDRWLRRGEAARLLNAARHGGRETRQYLPLFILIGLHTGARKEAILSLTWPQVDLERKRIAFAVPGRRKTKKRRPTLPIPNRLLPFLRYAWARRSSDIGPVVHLNGKPIQRVDKGFRAAVKRADLEDVTPHTLRHTRGTWLAQDGVSMWEIAGWLGQDPETTARIYAHHSPDFMDAARAAVDGRR
jgi:integrase